MQQPKRRFELTIRIAGDDWEEVYDRLNQDVIHDIDKAGVATHVMSASPTCSYFIHVHHDPEQTHERYHEQLDEYLDRVTPVVPAPGEEPPY